MSFIIGGAIGATLRFFVYERLKASTASYIPTLVVNVTGSFLLGLFLQYGNDSLYHLIVTGILSAFTTFSTFTVDNLKLLQAGKLLQCILNTIVNVIVCMLAVFVGLNI